MMQVVTFDSEAGQACWKGYEKDIHQYIEETFDEKDREEWCKALVSIWAFETIGLNRDGKIET